MPWPRNGTPPQRLRWRRRGRRAAGILKFACSHPKAECIGTPIPHTERIRSRKSCLYRVSVFPHRPPRNAANSYRPADLAKVVEKPLRRTQLRDGCKSRKVTTKCFLQRLTSYVTSCANCPLPNVVLMQGRMQSLRCAQLHQSKPLILISLVRKLQFNQIRYPFLESG
jgi:hypothetical protein